MKLLTLFTWPEDPTTGERVDWFRLPVRDRARSTFWRALGWMPAPMQPTLPLRSLVASWHGQPRLRFKREATA